MNAVDRPKAAVTASSKSMEKVIIVLLPKSFSVTHDYMPSIPLILKDYDRT